MTESILIFGFTTIAIVTLLGGGITLWRVLRSQVNSQEITNQISTQVMQQLEQKLSQDRQEINVFLTEQNKSTNESLAQIREKVAAIQESEKVLKELNEQVGGLRQIFANPKETGLFGETQLESIIESVLPPDMWEREKEVERSSPGPQGQQKVRFDFWIRLPDPPGPIGIDAKFPVAEFQKVLEASDETERKKLAKDFRTNISKKLSDIAAKYIIPGVTSDFALMFIPSEAMYATIHRDFDYIPFAARGKKVFIVSPSNLMASLYTIRSVTATMKVQQNAKLIFDEFKKITGDAIRLNERADLVRKRHESLGKAVNDVQISAIKVQKGIEKLEDPSVQNGTDLPDQLPN